MEASMSFYNSNHTSDLSKSAINSSVSYDFAGHSFEPLEGFMNKLDDENNQLVDLKRNVSDEVEILLKYMFGKGNYETVIRIAKPLIEDENCSNHKIFLNNILAECYALLGDDKTAIVHYKCVLELEPHLSKAHNNIAVSFKNIGDLRQAEYHLKCATELEPNYADAYNNLGTVHSDRSDLKSARQNFLKSIDI